MASWGLLQGLGKGLSSGSVMVNQAMSEDREVERQRMREASIEKRWQRQEQKDDARYADSLKFREEEVNRQKERDAVSDSRYADQKKAQDEDRAAQDKYRSDQLSLEKEKLGITTSERRRAEIEGTFEAVERKYQRELTKLDREYERKLDVARASGGDTEAIYKEYNTRVEALGKQELNDYLPLVKSYGSELKGTAVASYLDLLDQKPANTGSADPNAKPNVVNGFNGFNGEQAGNGRADLLKDLRAGAAGANTDTAAPVSVNPQPNFISGLNNGLSGAYGESGDADLSDASKLETFGYGVGTLAGIGPGLLGDAFQLAGAGAKTTLHPIWTTLTAKPSEMAAAKAAYAQQRFGGGNPPPPFPGETAEQYAARTGVKR